MAYNRIDKYYRQVVCQDLILSCQSKKIEEIPLFKSAQVSRVSLRNQRSNLGAAENSTWFERGLHLSGVLISWHLWGSRSAPFSISLRKAYQKRRTMGEKHERNCQSSITLRDQALWMAMEKYLIFLMPRARRKQRVVCLAKSLISCRDRIGYSAFYADTALGFCQYKLLETLAQNVSSERGDRGQLRLAPKPLLLERICLPCNKNLIDLLPKDPLVSGQGRQHREAVLQSGIKSCFPSDSSRDSKRDTLSLSCPSVLTAPEIQDVAQSGYMTLQGSLTLELS